MKKYFDNIRMVVCSLFILAIENVVITIGLFILFAATILLFLALL